VMRKILVIRSLAREGIDNKVKITGTKHINIIWVNKRDIFTNFKNSNIANIAISVTKMNR